MAGFGCELHNEIHQRPQGSVLELALDKMPLPPGVLAEQKRIVFVGRLGSTFAHRFLDSTKQSLGGVRRNADGLPADQDVSRELPHGVIDKQVRVPRLLQEGERAMFVCEDLRPLLDMF